MDDEMELALREVKDRMQRALEELELARLDLARIYTKLVLRTCTSNPTSTQRQK